MFSTVSDSLTKDMWWYIAVAVLLFIVFQYGKSYASKKEKFEVDCEEDGKDKKGKYVCKKGVKIYEPFSTEECSEDGVDENGKEYRCESNQKVYESFYEECESDDEYECVDGLRVLRS